MTHVPNSSPRGQAGGGSRDRRARLEGDSTESLDEALFGRLETPQAEADAPEAAEDEEPATTDDEARPDVAEESAVEEPAVEEPAVEEPVAEEPAAEEPAVEEPAVEEPAAEEPAAEEPAAAIVAVSDDAPPHGDDDDDGDDDEAAGTGPTRRERRQSETRGNLMTVLLALLALVIGAGIAAAVLSLTGGGDSGPPKDVAKNVQVKGTLPQVVARGADPAIGVAAPQIAGTSLDGSPLAVTQDGHPHLLVVVAHWCPHCQATVPRLVQLNSQGALNGISVYGIATATSPDRPNYPPSDWLKRENWPFPTFADDSNSDIAHKLGVTGFPFFVLVDANGKVVGRLAGELTDAQFVALFQALAAGKPLPITFGGTSSPAP